MIRPTWGATSDEQRKALADAVRAAQAAKKAEAAMWAAILKARNLDVPDEVVCRETGASRATLNRKYGSRSAPKATVETRKTAE